MAVTITPTTTNYSTFPSGRMSAFDSTGRLWTVVYDGANARYGFWYSDDGTSFTEATSLRVAAAHGFCAFAIDKTVNRAVFVRSSLMYVTNSIAPTSTWTLTGGWMAHPHDVVTFVKPGSTDYYVAAVGHLVGAGTVYPDIRVYGYTAAHGTTTDVQFLLPSSTTPLPDVRVDFRHTGDGSTVASSSPDLFVAWQSTATPTVYTKRLAWNGSGAWDAGPARDHGLAAAAPGSRLSAAFDGARHCLAWVDDTNNAVINVSERDAADTNTTARSITALADGQVTDLSVSYNSVGDMVVHAVGTTSDDVKRTTFRRSTGIWDAWTTIEATTVVNGTLYASKGWQPGKGIAVGWQEGSYNVRSETDFVNTPPLAPTWVSASGVAANRDAPLVLDWDFVDIDAAGGDAMTAYAIQKSVNGAAVVWWTGTVWGAETQITTATTSLTLLAGWAADGDSVVYKVKTYDQNNDVSPLSAGLTVIASVLFNPTITAPATNATITLSGPTVSWTVSEQTAYQLRILTSADVLLYSTGKVTSAAARSITLDYSLANGLVDIKFELTTWNNEDLASTPDINTGVDVTYVPPATPTYTVAANDAGGYIAVTIVDPTPTSTPPVVGHDVFVRVAAGGRQIGERTVGGDGIRIATGVAENATYFDYAAASGTDFEYRTRATGDNGGLAFGAWT